MLTYNTTLPFSAPQGLPAPDPQSPFTRYGSTHDDMLRAQVVANSAAYGIDQAKAANDYAMKQQDAERQLVLQGLQQMSQAQQNQNSLANTRIGSVSGLLSGLFR
jgi:hypothetical protein